MSYKPGYHSQQAVIFNWKQAMMKPDAKTGMFSSKIVQSSVLDLLSKALWNALGRPEQSQVKA